MTTKAFGVFAENKCIFGEGQCYAIYPRPTSAEYFMRRMREYHPGVEYEVREIEIDCEVATGIYVEGKEEDIKEGI